VSGIHHPARLGEDADVDDARLAVATLAPKEQIAGFGLRARNVLAQFGGVLRLGGSGWPYFVSSS
jgi:hypothetical protein